MCKVKVKVKCALVQALRLCTGRTAYRGSRGIAVPFHDCGTRRGWAVSVTPRPLLPPGKTRYLLYRRLGGPQGRSGHVRKISPPTGIRSPDRPARSQSLYRLIPIHNINRSVKDMTVLCVCVCVCGRQWNFTYNLGENRVVKYVTWIHFLIALSIGMNTKVYDFITI